MIGRSAARGPGRTRGREVGSVRGMRRRNGDVSLENGCCWLPVFASVLAGGGSGAVTGMDVQASIVMVCRVALGVVFLVAAVAKLSDLPAFAAGVRDYRILSEGQDRLVGSTLPFVEAAVGIVLILGV